MVLLKSNSTGGKTGPLTHYGTFISRIFLEYFHTTENICILWNWKEKNYGNWIFQPFSKIFLQHFHSMEGDHKVWWKKNWQQFCLFAHVSYWCWIFIRYQLHLLFFFSGSFCRIIEDPILKFRCLKWKDGCRNTRVCLFSECTIVFYWAN